MIENIFQLLNQSIAIHDLLQEAGAITARTPRDRNMKVSCPVHGADNRKSGFIYADTNTFRCYTCNESWDVVALCAQLHEMWKAGPEGEDVLDMGAAIGYLKDKYKIEYERPAWETRFRELKDSAAPSRGYEDFRQADREQMARLYLWNVSKALAPLDREARAIQWETVRALLDDIEDLDLGTPSWKPELNSWRERATLVIGGTNEHHGEPHPA